MNGRRIGALPLRVAVVAVAVASGARAQHDARLAALATGDAAAVEGARRWLIVGGADAVPVDGVRQLLRSADPVRRRAAGSVLLHHGLAPDLVAGWLADEADPRVLEPLVDLLPIEVLRRAVRTEYPEPPPDAPGSGVDHRLRLRGRALGRLLDAREVDAATWRTALASPELSRPAAALLAEEALPFPVDVLDGLGGTARRALLEALADRPRVETAAWLERELQSGGLGPAERLLALVALPSSAWPRDALRQLPEDCAAADPERRSLAARAAAALTEEQAERLIGEVHRRAVGGAGITDLLAALDRIGARGERHLVGLARGLSEEQRGAIVDWLSSRSSPVLDEIVGEALDGAYPLTQDLLRRSPSLLSEPQRLDRVRAVLEDPDAVPEMRIAAFGALVGRGVVEPGMLDFALDAEGDPRSRVRLLISMPPDALHAAEWRRLLAEAPHDAIREVMGRMAEAPIEVGLEADLERIAADGAGLGDDAARICLVAGRAPLAQRVWGALSVERRQYLASAVRQRRGEDWVLPALRSTAVIGDRFELPFARIVCGDRGELDALLADPGRWPSRWLRRGDEDVKALLVPGDVDRIDAALRSPAVDAEHRNELVRWLAGRPDLDVGPVLARVHTDDPDEDVRYSALRGLLRVPGEAERFRERVEQRMAAGLDDDDRDLAFEILGGFTPPLDAEECRFVARFALVGPLAYPDHELRTALREEPVADVALLNAVWQVAGREPSPHLAAALLAAAEEARAHPDAALASRQRLGRLLAILARTDATRRASAPIARAILDAPDLDPGFVGPANVVLAEAAEAEGAWEEAAARWRDAGRSCLRTPPEPLMLRAFVGDVWRAERRLPSAFLAARSSICAARAALSSGDVDAAARHLDAARVLGAGDATTESEIRVIQEEIRR